MAYRSLLILAAAVTLAACGDAEREAAAVQTPAPERPRGVVEDCSSQSSTGFGDEYADPGNVVVGPLAMLGAAHTPESTVREFGGEKILVLVRTGHRVTLALPAGTPRGASLGYGPLPQGVELRPRDGHRVVTFEACETAEASWSKANGEPVTFWSGFVLVASPRCVPLDVWVDEETAPRRVSLPMGVPECA